MTLQKRWFRIETGPDGSILSCEEVSSKGRAGSMVRYYEALTKAEACSAAKEWAERYRALRREASRRRYERLKEAGKCISCGRAAPRANGPSCEACASKQNELKRELRNGRPLMRPRLTPELLREREREGDRRTNDMRRNLWGGAQAHEHACTLKRFDRLGPDAFRADLCDRIRKAGGGKALDEYEASRQQPEQPVAFAREYADALAWDEPEAAE